MVANVSEPHNQSDLLLAQPSTEYALFFYTIYFIL